MGIVQPCPIGAKLWSESARFSTFTNKSKLWFDLEENVTNKICSPKQQLGRGFQYFWEKIKFSKKNFNFKILAFLAHLLTKVSYGST